MQADSFIESLAGTHKDPGTAVRHDANQWNSCEWAATTSDAPSIQRRTSQTQCSRTVQDHVLWLRAIMLTSRPGNGRNRSRDKGQHRGRGRRLRLAVPSQRQSCPEQIRTWPLTPWTGAKRSSDYRKRSARPDSCFADRPAPISFMQSDHSMAAWARAAAAKFGSWCQAYDSTASETGNRSLRPLTRILPCPVRIRPWPGREAAIRRREAAFRLGRRTRLPAAPAASQWPSDNDRPAPCRSCLNVECQLTPLGSAARPSGRDYFSVCYPPPGASTSVTPA